jgi:hypothetical protein
MASHHSRKHHKRASRKTHKRTSRKHSGRKHSGRKQQGGGSCAYMPSLNRQMVQTGGMASMESAYGPLLDAPTAVQAQVGSLNAAFAELASVIPKQQGGRRHSRKHSRKQKQSSRKQKQSSRKQKQSSRKQKQSSRRHRGGMHPFDSAFGPVAQQPAGASTQFTTEGEVNTMFGNYGPQHKA